MHINHTDQPEASFIRRVSGTNVCSFLVGSFRNNMKEKRQVK